MKAVPLAHLHAQQPRLSSNPDEVSVRPGPGLAQGPSQNGARGGPELRYSGLCPALPLLLLSHFSRVRLCVTP